MPKPIIPARFVAPMLPTLVDEAREGDAWIHEIQYDGYRTQLAIAGSTVQAFTRNGHDWSEKYAAVMKSARALRCQSAILDGEMCVQIAAGVTDFQAFKSAIKAAPHLLVLFAFDLLMLNGRDLRPEPLVDRRRRLKDLIGVDMVTLPAKERDTFWRRVESMGTSQARLAGLAKNKKATWIKEGLVARVRHLKGEDMLRHATMQSPEVGKPVRDDLGNRHGDED